MARTSPPGESPDVRSILVRGHSGEWPQPSPPTAFVPFIFLLLSLGESLVEPVSLRSTPAPSQLQAAQYPYYGSGLRLIGGGLMGPGFTPYSPLSSFFSHLFPLFILFLLLYVPPSRTLLEVLDASFIIAGFGNCCVHITHFGTGLLGQSGDGGALGTFW